MINYVIPQNNWISSKLLLHSFPMHGKGFFAKEKIMQGEIVVVWGGTNYTNKEQALLAQGSGKLIMQRDEDLFSIEDRGEDDTYFINHSCDGNLWMQDAFTLVARREILPGEEICITRSKGK